MFILFDETGEAEVDWRCFLTGLCLLMKSATFEEKLGYALALYDPKDEGTVSRSDCESVLGAMNETISWFGDKNLDEDELNALITQHFEGHPSIDASGKYEYKGTCFRVLVCFVLHLLTDSFGYK